MYVTGAELWRQVVHVFKAAECLHHPLLSHKMLFFSVLVPADLEKMNSLERISFLQEKLQDIRNHYLSLKSEVASIDRRRKRMKKKERESECGFYTVTSLCRSWC